MSLLLARTLAALLAWLGGDAPDASAAAEMARLEGHRVAVAPSGGAYVIEDVAGEGPPVVGVVVRLSGRKLGLRTSDGEVVELEGPLARPRIAGPGYKVWVVGERTRQGAFYARRLGVLAPPWMRR